MKGARTQTLGFALLAACALVVVAPVLLVVAVIVAKGAGIVSWTFLFQMPFDGMKQGGIFPAIVGTVLLTAGTALISIPVGIGGAIYLAEASGEIIEDTFRDNLSG